MQVLAASAATMACFAAAAQAHGGGGGHGHGDGNGHGHGHGGHGVQQPALTTRGGADHHRRRAAVPRPRPRRASDALRGLAPAGRRARRRPRRAAQPRAEGGAAWSTARCRSPATATTAAKLTPLIADRHLSTFITRLSAEAGQARRRRQRGPGAGRAAAVRHPGRDLDRPAQRVLGRPGPDRRRASAPPRCPTPPAWRAAGDPRLTRQLGDIVRQEYRAVGISEGLSPQADIATEPRWTRINGTFGSDPRTARDQVNAYVSGTPGRLARDRRTAPSRRSPSTGSATARRSMAMTATTTTGATRRSRATTSPST